MASLNNATVQCREEPVVCPTSGCARPFTTYRWFITNDVRHLMTTAGEKIFTLTMVCPACGETFHWNYSYSEMKKQTSLLVEILGILHGNLPRD